MTEAARNVLNTQETSGSAPRRRILAVDDDDILLELIEEKLIRLGYDVVSAENGKIACNILTRQKEEIDAILLDREMPGMSGLEVVEWIKLDADLRRIPVIMQTAATRPEQVKEGIDAGVFYYLTKPINDGVLESVVASALEISSRQKKLNLEMARHRSGFALVDRCDCRVSTLDEAESLSSFIAHFFPDPDRVLLGISELLVNAVEHGNLEIGYEAKSDMVAAGTWRADVQQRQALPKNRNKQVTVAFERDEDESFVIIQDEGDGFDWRSYMEIDPARATQNHGRGIAQANLVSFDKIEFNEAGNRVKATIKHEEEIDW